MSSLRIAHLSDPHFGTILPGVEDALIRALKDLKPDLILLSGDITQRARRRQFADAKAFTHKLDPIPFIAVPGNHDIPLFNLWARLFSPYRGFKKLFKDQLEKDFAHGNIKVFGLNSTSKWRHVQGDFDIARLKRRLNKSPAGEEKVRIAVFHHPVDCAKHIDEKNLLRGRDEAMRLFADAGIDLVIGGHIHDPYVNLSCDRYPQLPKACVVGVAGTCLSWRTRENAPNSFNFIEADSTSPAPVLRIQRYDLAENGAFVLKENHRFRRSEERGWLRN